MAADPLEGLPKYALRLPPDVSLGDLIEVVNHMQIQFIVTKPGLDPEQALFERWGPLAVYFRRDG